MVIVNASGHLPPAQSSPGRPFTSDAAVNSPAMLLSKIAPGAGSEAP
jgi:hypothetical protein